MYFLKQIYNFFASIHLAIFTLIALAVTSIIGTIIPQNETAAFYAKRFGVKTAQFLQVLDIPEMYASWWFLTLLILLAVNLIVCSIDRFPAVWKIIHTDNFSFSDGKLQAMEYCQQYTISPEAIARLNIADIFKTHGWSTANREDGRRVLYFTQKGKWSRTGVYLVHLSILVIFAGAIIGQLFGFKGSVMVPELQGTSTVYRMKTGEQVDLGFTVKCDSFAIEFYPNGMPKKYASQLSIDENGRQVLTRTIEVNKPLTYRGITFYQASYEGYQDFIITANEADTGRNHFFQVRYQQQMSWPEGQLHVGIINAEGFAENVQRMKIWVKAGNATPVIAWVHAGEPLSIEANGKHYRMSAKQMYATGLQVAKDPGVWVVYLGCALMILGLYMAFFMSHQRIWLLLQQGTGHEERDTLLLLAGTANKNKTGFTKAFAAIAKSVQESTGK